MNVLYDSHTFSEQTFGGISRYFVELINNLPYGYTPHLSLLASENAYLRHLSIKPSTISLKHFPEHRKLYYLINSIIDKHNLKRSSYDIFHPTGFDPYFTSRVKSPVVVTVHDMIYHHGLNPGKHTPEIMDNMRKTTMAADRVIAISETTKRSILQFYDIDETKIDVIHHGFNPVSDKNKRLPYFPERYILFVGHRGGYKNFKTLLDAFSIISQKDRSLYLMCTGKNFNKEEWEQINRLGLQSRCLCKFIPENDMNALYSNAECFVFPSKMEGFGMPILESFAAGCPAILSDSSCFPEIAGDAGIYFNPNDAEGLAVKIEQTVEDSMFRNEKIKAGKERVKLFSWKNTGIKTAETYKKAIS